MIFPCVSGRVHTRRRMLLGFDEVVRIDTRIHTRTRRPTSAHYIFYGANDRHYRTGPLVHSVRTINGTNNCSHNPHKRNTYRYTNPDTPIFIQRVHGLGEGPPSPHVSSWLRGRSAPGLHLLRRCGAPRVTSVSGFTSYRVSGGSRRRLTPDPTCRRAAPCSRPCHPRLQTARPQPWPASSVWWG
jgi:hypothetical protein